MKEFWKKNRLLHVALSVFVSFTAGALLMSPAVFTPMSSGRFKVDPSIKVDSRFRIITKETYSVTLWIGRLQEVDSDTFDRLTGCPHLTDVTKRPIWERGTTIPFQWSIRSSDDRIVARSNQPAITPPGNQCSSSAGGRLFSLGSFSIDPGRYQFEFGFSEEIPALRSFPTEIYIDCCGKSAHTWLSGALLFMNFFMMPIMLPLIALLVLILVIRAGIRIYAVGRANRLKPS